MATALAIYYQTLTAVERGTSPHVRRATSEKLSWLVNGAQFAVDQGAA
ncbi:hypothetical protein [Paenarthrobacter aromaticivorans]